MKRLCADDIRALHAIAAADKRLRTPDRVILGHVARTGVADPVRVAGPVNRSRDDVTKRLQRLVNLGYLPVDAK